MNDNTARKVTGCSSYQQDKIAALLDRHGITEARRVSFGYWMVDGRRPSRGVAAALSRLADNFGYSLHRTGRTEFSGSDRIVWTRV